MRTFCILAVAVYMIPCVPAHAGMQQDLADCPASKKAASAQACTRVLESGRLPRNQHYIAHFNRAWAYRLAGKSSLALGDYDRAVALNPKYAKSRVGRGTLHRDLGDYDKALADFDAVIRQDAKNWEGLVQRARTMRDLGRRSEALADVAKAERASPGQRQVQVFDALLAAEGGDARRALATIDRAIKQEANDAMAHYVRAVALNQSGDRGAALAETNRTLDIEPGFTAALSLRGRLQEQRGRNDLARDDYSQVLRLPLKHFDAALASSVARARLAKLEQAGGPVAALTEPARPKVQPIADRTCRRYVPAAAATIVVDCDH